jgi:outer membrane receptor protein involved in Fe transport
MTFVLNAMAAALAAVAQPAPVLSPPAPASKPAAAPATVQAVTVTGEAAQVTTSIDRRSYSLGKDISATSGSIADALRNVPSVAVDLQGGLTLRGDANVTILVDGKPSPAFEGAARADALQQLPADQIERVEVMTNPSAALNPEGSGGIINLVTKRSRGAGWSGSAYITAGSAGLKRAGINFGYNSKKFSLTGALSGNYQHTKSQLDDIRPILDPASGQFLDHELHIIGRSLTRGPTARLTAGYALTPKDQLSATVNYNELLIYGYPYTRYEDAAASNGPLVTQDRQGKRRFMSINTGLSAGWKHSFAGDGHTLSLDVLRNHSRYDDITVLTALRSAGLFPPLELDSIFAVNTHSELKAAYAQPLPGAAKLTAGYELRQDDYDANFLTARGTTTPTLAAVPALTYDSIYRLNINAAYTTYQRPIGDLDMQAGLRVEQAKLDIRELTTRVRDGQDYLRAYPSLHLAYKLDDQKKLTASYSTRVQRPGAYALLPLTVYVDPKNYQQGNPDLKPAITQSFELGYEQRKGSSLYLATLYYRQVKDEVTPVLRDRGGGVLLQTFDNLGSSRAAGLELTANGKLTSTLTYNANTTLSWAQISAANLGIAGDRSAVGVSGRVNLNWQARPDDLLQLNLAAQGKQLVAQGVVKPNWTLNMGWRHKVGGRVTATVSVQDLLNTSRFVRTFDTPTIHEDFRLKPVSRAILLRLDYRFGGGKPAADPAFDYGGGAAP